MDDTQLIILLTVNFLHFVISIINIVATVLLHFRFRSRCGMFQCLASPIKKLSPHKSETASFDDELEEV
jgi:hypothetical protein